ncbi:hypothetical protein PO909_016123 [Leuciscus waleckii]
MLTESSGAAVSRLRCKDCIASGKAGDIDVSVDKGKWYQKLADTHTESPQTALESNDWKEFLPSNIPPLYNYGYVYHWLVESLPTLPTRPTQTEDSDEEDDITSVVTEKSLRRGWQYVDSNFVQDIKVRQTHNSIVYKAKVDASMKNEHHDVSVEMSSVSGAVLSATCKCKASALGRCSHVAALLLFLTKVVDTDVGRTPACTDLPCEWKRGRKRKNPGSINAKSYGKLPPTKVKSFDPRPDGSHVKNEDVNAFLTELQGANSGTGVISMWETVLVYHYEDYDLPESHRDVITSLRSVYEANLLPKCSVQCISSMIPGTVEQSSSDVWYSERYLRMTASTCKEAHKIWEVIANCEQKMSAAVKLRLLHYIRKNVWGLDRITTKHMNEGIKNEDRARDSYVLFKKKTVPDFSCEKTGLFVSHRLPQLACSPDGLSYDPSTNSFGLAEIKILGLLQKKSPQECVDQYNSGEMTSKDIQATCFTISDNKLVLRRSHPYYYQVQYQLGVTGLEWCDFVLWSVKGDPSIERIYSDSNFIADIINSNYKLWSCVVMPELVEMRAPRNLIPFILPK